MCVCVCLQVKNGICKAKPYINCISESEERHVTKTYLKNLKQIPLLETTVKFIYVGKQKKKMKKNIARCLKFQFVSSFSLSSVNFEFIGR